MQTLQIDMPYLKPWVFGLISLTLTACGNPPPGDGDIATTYNTETPSAAEDRERLRETEDADERASRLGGNSGGSLQPIKDGVPFKGQWGINDLPGIVRPTTQPEIYIEFTDTNISAASKCVNLNWVYDATQSTISVDHGREFDKRSVLEQECDTHPTAFEAVFADRMSNATDYTVLSSTQIRLDSPKGSVILDRR